ncbi:hypothetical protein SEA_SCHWARTZ33_6 [Gordonia phage Schwartz33]|nr:hypothetical protein SEA_SCHWARTZ33_6 [Gordonia phage Schwartz33]
MAVANLFDPVEQRALPLSRGGDLRFYVRDDRTDPPTPFPEGTTGVLEIEHGEETIRFDGALDNGRLYFVLENEKTDSVPATTKSNKVRWTLRIAFADDPTTEIPLYEGPVYRGPYG